MRHKPGRMYRDIRIRLKNASPYRVAVLLLITLGILKVASSMYRRQIDLISLQKKIIEETKQFRDLEDICYAGYCGPWVEEYFMDFFFSKVMHVGRLYLPISWTNCHLKCSNDELEKLRDYVKDLDRSRQYFTVLQIDKGLQHPSLNILVDNDLDLMIFSAGGITRGDKIRNIHIPLLKDILSPTGLDKTLKVSFVGSTTHPIRSELQDMYGQAYNFTKTNDWKTIIEQSTFSLCPRGYGATSFRLYEAIQLRSIPIYVWEEDLMLAFSDILDWNTFSIVVHRNEISTLMEKIEQADTVKMSAALEAVAGYFTYEYTCKYILEKLRRSSSHVFFDLFV